MTNLVGVLYLIVVCVNLYVGFWVLLKSKNKYQRNVFFLFILVLEAWLLTNYFSHVLDDQTLSLVLARGTYLFGALIVPTFILFVKAFPKREKINYPTYLGLNIPILLMVYLSFTGQLVKDLKVVESGFNIYVNGNLIWAYSVFVGIYVVIYLRIFYKKFKQQKASDQLRLKYVVAGFIVASFIGIYFDLIIAARGAEFANGVYGPLGTIFISTTVAYAILRYRLMDITIVIRKSVMQIVTFAILFGLYAYVLLIIQRTSTSSISLSDNSTLLIIILIIAATMEPLRRLIYKFIDSQFESKERKQEEALKRLQFISTSNLHFSKLVERTTEELEQVFEVKPQFALFEQGILSSADKSIDLSAGDPLISKFQSGKIFIAEELQYASETGDQSMNLVSDFMHTEHLQAIVPIGKETDFVGVFIFHEGEKKIVFTSDKVEFLKKFISQCQLAFASSLAYKYAIERIKV